MQDSEGRPIGPDNGRFITGTDGTVTVSGLTPNATIVVTESKAPTGYLRDETPKNIVVRTGVANGLIFDDEPATTLIIQKFIFGTENEPLSGVCFKVTDGAGAAVGPDDGVYYTDFAFSSIARFNFSLHSFCVFASTIVRTISCSIKSCVKLKS